MEESGEVERATLFWTQVDVDQAFDELWEYLIHLRERIKTSTASDKECIQGMNIILESEVTLSVTIKNDSFEEVLIGEDILTVAVSDSYCPLVKLRDGPSLKMVAEDITLEDNSKNVENQQSKPDNPQPTMSPLQLDRNDPLTPRSPSQCDTYDSIVIMSPPSPCLNYEDLLAPLSPVQPSYQHHDCCPACLVRAPLHADHFLGHNPLRVPLLCQFQRQCAKLCHPEEEGVSEGEGPEWVGADVLYKAPCGRSLRCMAEVLQYLRQTDVLGVLQPENFSFNPRVVPERQVQLRAMGSVPPPSTPILFERDVSRGAEAVPVPLYNEVDGVRPADFRYRKERWPHGCFLSTASLFSACCDCTDGCADSQTCACLQLSLKAGSTADKLYSHQRLEEPVPTGLYECGPWCGCERSRCQNRVVQRGLRVRLQVFRTRHSGWGVRCRDDLDRGTFVCTYAGVVLRMGQSTDEPLPPKRQREEPVSDDEVEVVEEWTIPAAGRGAVTEPLDPSPPLHVPVIKRPADQPPLVLDGEKEQAEEKGQKEQLSRSREDCNQTEVEDKEEEEEEVVVVMKKPRLDQEEANGDEDTGASARGPKRDSHEQMYYLDATEEGNVGRFINHSCSPNLFVQNVFVDTHNPKFPTIAFFINRSVRAGTELTWNYSYDPGSDPEQELPCQCGSKDCQGMLI